MSREVSETFREISNMKPFSLLKCTVCDNKVERNYKEGDYVTKLTEDKCPKCSNPMYIKMIYVIIPKPQQQF